MGKSTTLNAISGVLPVLKGSVRFDGVISPALPRTRCARRAGASAGGAPAAVGRIDDEGVAVAALVQLVALHVVEGESCAWRLRW